MSNKTQLQTNNAALDALITRVNAAKDTAASLPEAGNGGGSVETCTVTITGFYSGGTCVITQYINGDFNVVSAIIDVPSTYENVVCGSGIYVNGSIIYASCTDGEILYYGSGCVYQAPKTAGVTATLTLERD